MNEVKPFQLIERCEAGESAAIEEFVRTYQPAAYRLALSILDDPDEADDATQDALVAALDHLKTYRGEAAFTTWLYAITLNLCRGRLRKRRSYERMARLLRVIFQMPDESRQPEAAVQKIEEDSALWHAIERLSERQREVIVLRYYHDLPIANISLVTGVSQRTVHNRLRAAHERLGILLGRDDLR